MIDDSKFLNNEAELGGVIYLSNIPGTIKNCEFTNNSAVLEGGVVYSHMDQSTKTEGLEVLVSRSSFTSNKAKVKGAVFAWDFKPLVTSGISYEDNQCDGLTNSDSYEPDFMALLVPKQSSSLLLLDM